MFLSRILVDIGENPDRLRPGRGWLRNHYRVHQRLSMAFPGKTKKASDPDFLSPYQPTDFFGASEGESVAHVHAVRKTESGFLFRVEPVHAARAVILVQSATQPDWGYAFHNASYLLAAPVECKPYTPVFAGGQSCRFRLMANPTRKLKVEGRKQGRRVPLPVDQHIDWIQRKCSDAGCEVDIDSVSAQRGTVRIGKGKDETRKIQTVLYDGVLQVTDPESMCRSIVAGIGSSKAFGCGLLSVIPLRVGS